MKSTFKFIYDLGSLTNEARAQYVRDASIYFGLDPDLNLLDIIWMESGDNLRNMVLYARRGACEILRDIHKISIVNLEGPTEVGGTVVFKATATNSFGRQEISTGSQSILGLSGKRLSNALMAAQTKSLRRVTLQMVGGALLDESEVHDTTSDISVSTASLAQLAGSPTVIPPMTAPIAPAPGKDITDIDEGAVLQEIEYSRLRHEAQEAVKSEIAKTEQKIVNLTTPPEAPKKRTSRKRNMVNLASPGQAPVQTEMPVGQIDAKGEITPVSPTADIPGSQRTLPSAADLDTVVKEEEIKLATTSPVISPSIPMSPEKKKEFKARFSEYSQRILPGAGGMVPTDGVGGITMKLRLFAEKFTGTTDMNEVQFETFLKFLDDYVKEHGVPALVQYIDAAIGAVKS